jgi:hypothetical protein
MKVYIGYQCNYNYCDVFKDVAKVFDDEVKALVWRDEFKETDTDFREYTEMELE